MLAGPEADPLKPSDPGTRSRGHTCTFRGLARGKHSSHPALHPCPPSWSLCSPSASLSPTGAPRPPSFLALLQAHPQPPSLEASALASRLPVGGQHSRTQSPTRTDGRPLHPPDTLGVLRTTTRPAGTHLFLCGSKCRTVSLQGTGRPAPGAGRTRPCRQTGPVAQGSRGRDRPHPRPPLAPSPARPSALP